MGLIREDRNMIIVDKIDGKPAIKQPDEAATPAQPFSSIYQEKGSIPPPSRQSLDNVEPQISQPPHQDISDASQPPKKIDFDNLQMNNNGKKWMIIAIVLAVLFVLLGTSLTKGYFMYEGQKKIIESKSNCPVCEKTVCPTCPVCPAVETPAPTTTPSTSKKSTSSSSSSSETVLAPPAPPSD